MAAALSGCAILTAMDATELLPQQAEAACDAGIGGMRAVIERLVVAIDSSAPAVLGLVIATEGSTYAKTGAALLLGAPELRCGWISGGCLEPGLDAEAIDVAECGRARCIELDTRADADLFFGSRLGCRGLLRIALMPVAQLAPLRDPLRRWSTQHMPLDLALDGAGLLISSHATSAFAALHWEQGSAVRVHEAVRLHWPAAPRVLLFGAGPEAATLLPLLHRLGWYVDLVERRPRWRGVLALADRCIEAAPSAAGAGISFDHVAALVMNHDFELDRESLELLATTAIPFVGLLGPPARRDDLLALLPPAQRDVLRERLHAPVGLDLGGRGPEAIALAIAAQLQVQMPATTTA